MTHFLLGRPCRLSPIPVPAPCEHSQPAPVCDHVVAIHRYIRGGLNLLAVVLPQKVNGPEATGDVPAVLRGVAKRLVQRPKEELAKDEVVSLRPSLKDGLTVELDKGLQQ